MFDSTKRTAPSKEWPLSSGMMWEEYPKSFGLHHPVHQPGSKSSRDPSPQSGRLLAFAMLPSKLQEYEAIANNQSKS